MHMEHIAQNNAPAIDASVGDEHIMQTADVRYTAIINGPRAIGSRPLYIHPSLEERSSGFCAELQLDPAHSLYSDAILDPNDWMLVKCPPNVLRDRENLVGESVVICWEDSSWFIAKVNRVEGRRHVVTFIGDDSYAKVRLAGCDWEAQPEGKGMHWRLVARRSTTAEFDSESKDTTTQYKLTSVDVLALFCSASEFCGSIDPYLASISSPHPTFGTGIKRAAPDEPEKCESEKKRYKKGEE